MQGVLVANDYSNRVITFRDKNSEIKAYDVSEGAVIKINNKAASLYALEKEMQLEIEIHDNKITYINGKSTVMGTVVAVNPDTMVMELTLSTGERKTYNIANNYDIYMKEPTRYDLDDLVRGDIVEVKIENNKVIELQVQKEVAHEIIDVATSSNRIRVENNRGSREYLYLESDIKIEIPGILNPTIRDLHEGDIIKATYLGYTLQKVEVVPIVRGAITSIDYYDKTIIVKGYDGKTHTFHFNNNSRIIKSGDKYRTLDTAQVGDRVEVEENIDAGRNISLMSKISGRVAFMHPDQNRVFLQQNQASWIPYDILSTAHIHNGFLELKLTDIKANDSLELYIANNTVYEVLKK